MKILKRAGVVAAASLALLGPAVVAASPAYAASMNCSTSRSGSGYWFYCNGDFNTTPWVQVTCVPLFGSNWTYGWQYPGTMYAPWSFSQYMSCGNEPWVFTDMPRWGHN